MILFFTLAQFWKRPVSLSSLVARLDMCLNSTSTRWEISFANLPCRNFRSFWLDVWNICALKFAFLILFRIHFVRWMTSAILSMGMPVLSNWASLAPLKALLSPSVVMFPIITGLSLDKMDDIQALASLYSSPANEWGWFLVYCVSYFSVVVVVVVVVVLLLLLLVIFDKLTREITLTSTTGNF